MDKIISSFFKSSARLLLGFSICVIILAVGTYCIDGNIAPRNIFILAWMFLCLTIISTIEMSISGLRKWAVIPYWIKKFIFMPFYAAITITANLHLGSVRDNIKRNIVFVIALFVVVYLIASLIKYCIEKKQTDKMNDALLMFQKEIEKEDEEM